MIKTATVYSLRHVDCHQLSVIDFDMNKVGDPSPMQWGRLGFAPLSTGRMDHSVMGGLVFNVQFRDRVLPGKVIQTKLAERVAEAERRMGKPPNKKEVMQMKDALVSSLLPTAFIKQTDVPVIVIKRDIGGYLLIGSGSATKVDEIVDLLAACVDEPLGMIPFDMGLDLPKFIRTVLQDERVEDFVCGESLVLKGPDKSTVRMKDMNVHGNSDSFEPVSEHLSHGFEPVELHIHYDEKLGFALNDKGIVKRIKFADVLLKDVDESSGAKSDPDHDAAYFDGTAALVIGEMGQMLDALNDAAAKTETAESVEDDEL